MGVVFNAKGDGGWREPVEFIEMEGHTLDGVPWESLKKGKAYTFGRGARIIPVRTDYDSVHMCYSTADLAYQHRKRLANPVRIRVRKILSDYIIGTECPRKTMQEYQKRVIEEREELDKRIKSLKNFISTEVFGGLAKEDRDLLVLQLSIMEDYTTTLSRRIERF